MKTIYKDNIWRQIIHFVKEERWDGEYTRETDLVKDLQLREMMPMNLSVCLVRNLTWIL